MHVVCVCVHVCKLACSHECNACKLADVCQRARVRVRAQASGVVCAVALWCGCHHRDIPEINCSPEVPPGEGMSHRYSELEVFCSFHVLTTAEHISQAF